MDTLLPSELTALAARVIAENKAAGRMVALAESCTGGLVAAALTEIAGSSAVVERGFVAHGHEVVEGGHGREADVQRQLLHGRGGGAAHAASSLVSGLGGRRAGGAACR